MAYSSAACVVDAAIVPFAERLATAPSLVFGVYAPPVKV
jgi:hypothetical protein